VSCLYANGTRYFWLTVRLIMPFLFIYFFRIKRPRPPLGHTKDSRESRYLRCFWNIDTRTVLWIWFFLLCVKDIFFWCYGSFRFSKGIINTLEKYYVSHGMCWPCNFCFHHVTDNILFTLQGYFNRSVPVSFLSIFRSFRWEQNCRALLLKQVQRSEQKWNCKPSKEHAMIMSLVGK